MSPVPTGRLFRIGDGADLVLTRRFRAPAEDVWASLTESERTARWFGPWEGDAAPGRTVKVQMAFEEGAPWFDMHIDACEPPRRLAVSAVDESGTWRTEVALSEVDGETELRFTHHLDSTDAVGDYGPGWEYYLDMFVAARDGAPQVSFETYYPALKPYYEGLTAS